MRNTAREEEVYRGRNDGGTDDGNPDCQRETQTAADTSGRGRPGSVRGRLRFFSSWCSVVLVFLVFLVLIFYPLIPGKKKVSGGSPLTLKN